MTDQDILLSTAYLPPVQYLSKFLIHPAIWIETQENFIKQSYRNRTIILTANGPEPLIIPIEKGRSPKQKIIDLRISYDTNWQHIHWNAIVSAYNSSPFFEILEADFKPFYETKFEFLFEFNMELLKLVLDIMEVTPKIEFTKDFEKVTTTFSNYRESIHPKPKKSTDDSTFHPATYTQVFDDRFGFVPNLSIIDLLFNCGLESYEILTKSYRSTPKQPPNSISRYSRKKMKWIQIR